MKLFLFCVPLTFLTSCGMFRDKDKDADAPAGRATHNCQTEDDHANPRHLTERRLSADILRQYQRVIRKDETGKLLSDQVETVGPPRKRLSFKAERNHGDELKGFTLYNRQTCATNQGDIHLSAEMRADDNPLIVLIRSLTALIDTAGNAEFTADMADALFTLHVRQAVNTIDYKFAGPCKHALRGNHSQSFFDRCQDFEVLEEGLIKLTVSYREETLPGIKNIVETK